MSNITFSNKFNQYNLYTGSKNIKGFYTAILHKIDLIINDSLENFEIPVSGHIIIDKSNDYRINQVLSRIIAAEARTRGIETPKFHYISVTERRRNDQHFHQHLALIIDKGDYEYFKVIQFELRRYSRTAKVKLIKRKHDTRPEYIDLATGEVRKTGSLYLHNLRKETFDAFERISYIAKVETKTSPSFSSSRLFGPIKRCNLLDTEINPESFTQKIPYNYSDLSQNNTYSF